MAIGFVWLGQHMAAKALFDEASKKLEHAITFTATIVTIQAGFPKHRRVKYAYRKGGFQRSDSVDIVFVANPKAAWYYWPAEKKYQSAPVLAKDPNAAKSCGLGIMDSSLQIVGGPTQVTWQGVDALRLELDGSKKLGVNAKILMFFDVKTHLPIGMSIGQSPHLDGMILEDAKINPKLNDSLFSFTPPKGWSKKKP